MNERRSENTVVTELMEVKRYSYCTVMAANAIEHNAASMRRKMVHNTKFQHSSNACMYL
jgi:hypothetical protein